MARSITRLWVVAAVVSLAAGCGDRSAELVARDLALDYATQIAGDVEAIGSAPSGDPGTPDYNPPVDNAGLVKSIEERVRNYPSDVPWEVLTSRSKPGWTGELGAVEAKLYTFGEAGASWTAEEAEARTCVRFVITGGDGPRDVTVKEIDCP